MLCKRRMRIGTRYQTIVRRNFFGSETGMTCVTGGHGGSMPSSPIFLLAVG